MKKHNKVLLPLILSIMSAGASAASLEEILHQSKMNDIKANAMHEDLTRIVEERNYIDSQYMPQVNLQGNTDLSLLNESDLRDYESFLSASVGVNGTLALYDPTKKSQQSVQSYKEAIAYYNVINYMNDTNVVVTKLYYDILMHRDSVSVDKESHKAYDQQYRKVKDMAEAGLRTLVDVAEVQAQLDQAEAALLTSETNLEIAISKLYVYTGDYSLVPDSISFEEETHNLQSVPYDEWLLDLQTKNISLKIAKFQELLAKETIKLTESEDNFRANLTSGIAATYNNERFDDFEYNASIGVNFSLPVYDGGANASKTKQATHAYNKAALDAQYAYRQLEPTLRALYGELSSTERSIRAMEKAVESSKYSYEAIKSGYEIGTRDMLDVLNANADYSLSQKNLYSSQYNYLIKQAEFESLVIFTPESK
ncbi:TolC family protein [Vibrio splendidus]|nr:TolC family protein [Vibrio splendidus]MCC4880700.1 TolC family protein [Vibrio splendidus]